MYSQIVNDIIELEDYITFPNNVLPLRHMYTNAFVEIVHETDINDNNFFITEKTIRPILFKKPCFQRF